MWKSHQLSLTLVTCQDLNFINVSKNKGLSILNMGKDGRTKYFNFSLKDVISIADQIPNEKKKVRNLLEVFFLC